MRVQKEIAEIKRRLAIVEAHISKTRHAVTKKVEEVKLRFDSLLRREQNEEAPVFTDAELYRHNSLHKANLLPFHKHKPSTTAQFADWVRRDAEKKDKAADKRIAAERKAQAQENEDLKKWKWIIKNRPPAKVTVQLHPKTPKGPYAWITWEMSRPWDEKYYIAGVKVKGFYIEINGSTWPMRPVNRRKELLRSWRKGSKVRVGIQYQWGNHYGTSWSCFKHWN